MCKHEVLIILSNRYCSTLPSDGTAVLTPYWMVDEISSAKLQKIEINHREHLKLIGSSVNNRLFQCTVYLPLNSPVRDQIVGRVMPSKRLAKQDAALKACIRLHESGELDDQHLLPLNKSVAKDIELVDADDFCEPEISSDNYYLRGVARVFVRGLVPPFYLYLISFELENHSGASQQESWFDASRAKHRLGFLSSEKLPSLNPFGLFSPIGQVYVTVFEIGSSLRLKNEDIQLCHQFQQYIFKNILELPKEEPYNYSCCSYLIVPVNLTNMQIDLDFIFQLLTNAVDEWQHTSTQQDYTIYNDAVVSALHDENKSKRNYYYVEDIRYDLTPKSTFPNASFPSPFPTYNHYYRNRFNVIIKDQNQPLLEVSKESFKSFNFLTPK